MNACYQRTKKYHMMKIAKKNELLVGLTIDRFKGIQPSTLIKIINKLGLEFAELTKSVFDDLENVKKTLGNMETGLHLPNLHDSGFDFSNKSRESDIKNLIKLINENHQELNINYCLSHPPEGKTAKEKWEESTNYLLENLKQIDAPLIIENVQSLDEKEFEAFYQKAKDVLGDKLIGQCFDAPHYLLSGNDPVEFIGKADGRMKCLHLSDCQDNFDAHLPFGQGGGLPVDEILAQLKKTDYSGFINLELLPRSWKDIRPLIDSYLKVVRTFSRKKYFKTKIRLFFYSILLRTKVKDAFQK